MKFVYWTFITKYGMEVSGEFWGHEWRREDKKVELMSIFIIMLLFQNCCDYLLWLINVLNFRT